MRIWLFKLLNAPLVWKVATWLFNRLISLSFLESKVSAIVRASYISWNLSRISWSSLVASLQSSQNSLLSIWNSVISLLIKQVIPVKKAWKAETLPNSQYSLRVTFQQTLALLRFASYSRALENQSQKSLYSSSINATVLIIVIAIKISVMGVDINEKGNAKRLKSRRNVKDYRKRARVIEMAIRFGILV